MFSSPKSEVEDNKIKQRIVGALVLIALAVIIVPLLLDFRKDYDHVIKGTNIPPKPDDFHVEVVPLNPPEELKSLPAVEDSDEVKKTPSTETAGPGTSAEKPATSPAKAAPKTAIAKPAVKAAKTTAASKPAKEASEKEAPKQESTPVEEGWIVQLGSFSNKENAEELRDQLQKKGYKAFVDEVSVDGKPIQRVRIGPLDKKSGAQAIRDKLAAEMKLDAIVLSYQ